MTDIKSVEKRDTNVFYYLNPFRGNKNTIHLCGEFMSGVCLFNRVMRMRRCMQNEISSLAPERLIETLIRELSGGETGIIKVENRPRMKETSPAYYGEGWAELKEVGDTDNYKRDGWKEK